MIWLAIISTAVSAGTGYSTTFAETRSLTDCMRVVRNAEAMRPGYVTGRCVKIRGK